MGSVLTTLANVGGSHLVGASSRRFEAMMAAFTNASKGFTDGLVLTRGLSPPMRQEGRAQLRARAASQAEAVQEYNKAQHQLGVQSDLVWHVTDNL